MAIFEGYLLAYPISKNNIARFPHEFIQIETWNSTPNQREEKKAYRDDNTRDLIRITAPGKKTVFSFKTIPDLHLAEKEQIQNFFYSRMTTDEAKLQRKIRLKYWNDEDNEYKISDFYIPNMPFPIKKISKDDIIYGELQFDFVEY